MRRASSLAALAAVLLTLAPEAASAQARMGEMLAQRTPRQDEVDLRGKIDQLGLTVRDQGQRPTSAAFAMAFLLDYAYRNRARPEPGKTLPLMSPEFVNWEGNGGLGLPGDGGYLSDMANGFGLFGAMADAQVPYAPAFAAGNVPPEVRTQGVKFLEGHITERANDGRYGVDPAVVEDMVRALDAGTPVAASVKLKADPATVSVDGLKVWDRLDAPDLDFANYSLALVGYHRNPNSPGGGWFIGRTALGPQAGDKGYVYLSFRYVRDNLAEAVFVPIRDLPFPLPAPETSPVAKRLGYAPPVASRAMAEKAAARSGVVK